MSCATVRIVSAAAINYTTDAYELVARDEAFQPPLIGCEHVEAHGAA